MSDGSNTKGESHRPGVCVWRSTVDLDEAFKAIQAPRPARSVAFKRNPVRDALVPHAHLGAPWHRTEPDGDMFFPS